MDTLARPYEKESVLNQCQTTIDAIALHLAGSRGSLVQRKPGKSPVTGMKNPLLRIERALKAAERVNRSFAGENVMTEGSGERYSPKNREGSLSNSFSGTVRQVEDSYSESSYRPSTPLSLSRTQQELQHERILRHSLELQLQDFKSALDSLRQQHSSELQHKTHNYTLCLRKLDEEVTAHQRTRLQLQESEKLISEFTLQISDLRQQNDDLKTKLTQKSSEMLELEGKYAKLKQESDECIYKLVSETTKNHAESTESIKSKLKSIEATRRADRELYQSEISRLQKQLISLQSSSDTHWNEVKSGHIETSKVLGSRISLLSDRLQARMEDWGRKSVPFGKVVGKKGRNEEILREMHTERFSLER